MESNQAFETMSLLSFSITLLSSSTSNPLFISSNPSLNPRKPTPSFIRMGGGPRTFPGGVSKWQWKRMQAKKSNQLLKARLCRERQIYDMRKRSELKSAVTELERPWEPVQKAPNLFSVTADEQLKVMADRFQKPGGFDLWTERDGPQLFETPVGLPLPTARFFPKGVVHSLKPYGKVNSVDSEYRSDDSDEELETESVIESFEVEPELRSGKVKSVVESLQAAPERRIGGKSKSWRKKKKEQVGFENKQKGEKREDMRGLVYDISTHSKWAYRFQDKNGGFDSEYEVKAAEFQELE